MATVHLGRLVGPVGFSRTVVIKKLRSSLSSDPQFVSMFLDEARLASRVTHPNVVATLDVVALQGELFLVMEHVPGVSLARLLQATAKRKEYVPPAVAAGVVVGLLQGLHAAHESSNERGEPLGLVHRDVSPQNLLVGAEGVPHVIDFGVAKAAGRVQITNKSQLKGKVAYMSPEQVRGEVDRRTDVYAASVVFWETLTGRRLFRGETEGIILGKVLGEPVRPTGALTPNIPKELDAVVLKGLSRNPDERYQTARDMARAIEEVITVAGSSAIGAWVEGLAGPELTERRRLLAQLEHGVVPEIPPAPMPVVPPAFPSEPSLDDETTIDDDRTLDDDRTQAMDNPPVTEDSLETQMTSSRATLMRFVPKGRGRLVALGVAGVAALVLLATALTCRGRGGSGGVAAVAPAAMDSESAAVAAPSAEAPAPASAESETAEPQVSASASVSTHP